LILSADFQEILVTGEALPIMSVFEKSIKTYGLAHEETTAFRKSSLSHLHVLDYKAWYGATNA
jgi:hypothetical protein